MKTISRYIMTLALLLTAVTGAWADSKVTVKELTASEITAWATDENPLTAADLPGFVEATTEQAQSWDGYPTNGIVYLIYGFDNGEMKKITYVSGNAMTPSQNPKTRASVYEDINSSTPDRYFYVTGIEAPTTVEWNASTKTGTFSMPGSDVVLTPIYAKAATFATTGTGSEVKPLLPAAAEGVIAGTDASLIAEGTGIVAFAGTSTDVKQGTLMYAIGTSATQAPALTAFSATAPTAKDVADDGATVYVWYYIQGADAPQGEAATLDNTFDDTEPAYITVQVLTNKFDITLNAANANTIEAGKATVTVGGNPATVTDGKLKGVKMGSEVKLEANPGYKFRKVEVKKGAATPSLSLTSPAVGQFIGSDGKNYAAKATMPTGVTKVAMITYVGSETGHDTYKSGLAIALTDEGEMDWATAKSTCEAKSTFTNAAWMVPSVPQWCAMCKATGNNGDLYYGSMKYAMIATAGEESSFKEDGYHYWSSSENGSIAAFCFSLKDDSTNMASDSKNNINGVRAVLAF